MDHLLRFAAWVDRLSDAFGALARWSVAASCFISAGNAVVRHVAGISSNGMLEIQWYLLAVCVMLGAPKVLRLNEHVRVDLFYGRWSARGQATIDIAASVVGRNSRLSIVGLAGGTLHYAANNPPYGTQVTVPYWGSRTELMEVIALAQSGRIKATVETFPLEQANDVYQRLRDGKVQGRAILIP